MMLYFALHQFQDDPHLHGETVSLGKFEFVGYPPQRRELPSETKASQAHCIVGLVDGEPALICKNAATLFSPMEIIVEAGAQC